MSNSIRMGVDVGGTFTDFVMVWMDNATVSTPANDSPPKAIQARQSWTAHSGSWTKHRSRLARLPA